MWKYNEKTVYWAKYILYVTSFVWVLYLAVFFHELGHAVTVVSLGGTLEEFVVTWDFRGYVRWTQENIPMSEAPRIVTLVSVSGGIGAALFFLVLSHKSKWFAVPALFCLVDGFGEAMYQADTRFYAINGMGLAVLVICAMLLWQFETRERDKRIDKVGNRKYRRPKHISYEEAMNAIDEFRDRMEKEHEELRDLEEVI
jgi:hypothetical protein